MAHQILDPRFSILDPPTHSCPQMTQIDADPQKGTSSACISVICGKFNGHFGRLRIQWADSLFLWWDPASSIEHRASKTDLC